MPVGFFFFYYKGVIFVTHYLKGVEKGEGEHIFRLDVPSSQGNVTTAAGFRFTQPINNINTAYTKDRHLTAAFIYLLRLNKARKPTRAFQYRVPFLKVLESPRPS